MAINKGLKLNVPIGIEVSEDFAELALKIINIYCNENNLTIKDIPVKDEIRTKMSFVQKPYDFYEKENNK